MDLKEIRAVVDMMKKADLSEFEIEEEGLKLRIARGRPATEMPQVQYAVPPVPQPTTTVAAAPASAGAPEAAAAQKPEPKGHVIKSPMVGTFYRAPSPESPPFVEVGSKITENSVVCIIEAMKVMNEIQAEVRGTVTEVLVENGESVEYGQPLFRVDPA